MSAGSDTTRRRSETVLLVEDADAVRRFVCLALERLGHNVISANSGPAALELVRDGVAQGIDLLVTDLVMPDMNGRELAERLRRLLPALKVLFMSGYANGTFIAQGLQEGENFLQKPFDLTSLAAKVREALDA